ncbi:MAG: glucose-6-phosphate isomerase family protein [Halobacteriota archaeon]|nr:glucose-6-phosphate isomerase family protein [Halobacteriota archaeon]
MSEEGYVIGSDRVMQIGSRSVSPDVRRLHDMDDVIYDREWLKKARDTDLYYMYRGVCLSKNDEDKMKEYNLRYDVTVIPPGNLGVEYVKTAGHYHPPLPNSELTYGETYEVLKGTAHYLLQDNVDGKVTDVILIEANAGDKVIIPPNYGHITINPSNKAIMMTNWVSSVFSSVYDQIKENKGGAYFETTDGKFIKNEKYEDLPDIRFLSPTTQLDVGSKVGLKKDKEMYGLIREDPELLNYLNEPSEYDWLFNEILDTK